MLKKYIIESTALVLLGGQFLCVSAFADIHCPNLGDAFYAPEAPIVSKSLSGEILVHTKKNAIKVTYTAEAAIKYQDMRYSDYHEDGTGYNPWGYNTEHRSFSNKFTAKLISQASGKPGYVEIKKVTGEWAEGKLYGYDVYIFSLDQGNVTMDIYNVRTENIKLSDDEILKRVRKLTPKNILKFDSCTEH